MKLIRINKITVQVIFTIFLISIAHSQADTIETTVPALKNVFAKDFTIGCLLSYPHVGFSTDPPVPGQSAVVAPNGGYLIKYHMNSMSPGNNMKPQYTVNISGSASAYNTAATQAAKDSIDVNPIIQFNGNLIAQLNWAKRQGFTFRGHTLVWHSQTPGTAFFRSGYTTNGTRLTPEKMNQRLENYIKEVIRIINKDWPGMLTAMDVLNEVIDDGTGSVRTTNNEWYTTYGDSSYIMKSFEYARKYSVQYGETQMKLYYNDYNTHSSLKADGIVRVMKPVYQAGFLDGIGMQDHDNLTTPTAAQWIASYNKFDSICTEMAVTEIDVSTGSGTNNPSASILTQQANQYGQLFKLFVERSYYSGRGKIINVSKDGLNDQYTFVTNQSSSLWTTLNKCKPAFFAVVDVGIYYNLLDSLIKHSDTLKQNEYTPETWTAFSSVLASSKNAKNQNYSVSVSAATALKNAFDNLKTAVSNLIKTSIKTENGAPSQFVLKQNFPNPFNPTTTIQYQVPISGFVSLKVFDVLGQEVATLVEGNIQPGNYAVPFNGSLLSSGVYLYQLRSGNFVETKRFLLLK